MENPRWRAQMGEAMGELPKLGRKSANSKMGSDAQFSFEWCLPEEKKGLQEKSTFFSREMERGKSERKHGRPYFRQRSS